MTEVYNFNIAPHADGEPYPSPQKEGDSKFSSEKDKNSPPPSPLFALAAATDLVTKIPLSVSLPGIALAGAVKWFASQDNEHKKLEELRLRVDKVRSLLPIILRTKTRRM